MPNLRQGMMGAAGAGAGGYISGTMWVWGRGYYGAMGEDQDDLMAPTQLGSDEDWSFPGLGTQGGVFVKSDGTLWGKGRNNVGQLGLGNVVDYSSPVQVGALTDWFFARALGTSAEGFVVAVKADGTIWTWGIGAKGQLGQENVLNYSSPVQVGSLTDWAGITSDELEAGLGLKLTATNYSWACIKDDGTLWTCGGVNGNCIGDGAHVSRSSPVQVGSLTDWESVAGGSDHVMATRTGGTLWAWGSGGYGRLGTGAVINVSSPIQIGSLTTWSSVSGQQESTHMINDAGQLWGTGKVEDGQLGNGEAGYVNFSSPIQIGSLTDWAISLNAQGGIGGRALKTDGSLWGWGRGYINGDGTGTDRSSPVQAAGSYTDWGKTMGTGNSGAWAIRVT